MATTPNPNPNPNPQPKKKKTKPSAFADVLQEWASLLTAVADRAPDMAPVEPHRAALAETLEKAKKAKGVQESHGASRQSTTQTLKEILVEGKDRAIRLRGAIRAELGPTTEQLTQFGIRPLRRRPLRHKSETPSAPAPPVEIQAAKADPGAK
ncbi:MAG: hypothetical protein QOJ16_887 [Acidobacteriota bacterium]|jgi:hypothetical protein|nr:hypothetical protein [Acidobacteriota bacterium]